MRRLTILAALLGVAAPASALAQYRVPNPPPDPASQLAEQVSLYDRICLRAFPDDRAVTAAMGEMAGATAMSAAEVARYLQDDPGFGWNVDGQEARFAVTVETGSVHACGVRTMTANGFPDLAPYRALVARYTRGRSFSPIARQSFTVRDIMTTGDGQRSADGGDVLMMISSTPIEEIRTEGNTAVEVRFVHSMSEGADAPK